MKTGSNTVLRLAVTIVILVPGMIYLRANDLNDWTYTLIVAVIGFGAGHLVAAAFKKKAPAAEGQDLSALPNPTSQECYWDDMVEENGMMMMHGKPFTGICHKVNKNAALTGPYNEKEISFAEGSREGITRTFDPQGNLMLEETFAKDACVKSVKLY